MTMQDTGPAALKRHRTGEACIGCGHELWVVLGEVTAFCDWCRREVVRGRHPGGDMPEAES